MRTALVTIVLLGGLAAAVAYGIQAWLTMGDVELGFHGTLAIVLCVVFVTGLGVGLMRLSYYSHRHGHDDRAAGADPEADGQD
jgi:hypothetical protein